MTKTEKDFRLDIKKASSTVKMAQEALNCYDIMELRNIQSLLEKYIKTFKDNKKLENFKYLDKNLKNQAKELLKQLTKLLAETDNVIVKLTTPHVINAKNV